MYFNSYLGKCLVTIGLHVAICCTSFAQAFPDGNQNRTGTKNNARVLTDVERRALENLDRVALEARQIDNATIRTELQTLIADALWDFDKPHAKNIFLDAFKNARAIQDTRQSVVVQTQVIARVWRRDRALADELMKQLGSSTKESGESDSDFGVSKQFGMKSSNPVNQQKLELARELLESDSRGATELIGITLQSDVTFAGINLLAQLRSKDAMAADMIFQRAVNQLPGMQVTAGVTAAIAMGDYLAPSCALCGPPSITSPNVSAYYASAFAVLRKSLGQSFAPPPVKRDLQDRLVQYFHESQAILALTLSKFAGPSDIAELETIFQQQMQLVEASKQRKLEALRNLQRSPDRFEDLRQNAETIADSEQRDKAIFSLVEGTVRQYPSDDRLARLVPLIDKIEASELRDRALSLCKSVKVDKLIRTGSFDAAYALAIRMPDAGLRAQSLRDLSLAIIRKGSLTLPSQDVLSEALESANKAGASIERSKLTFRIAADFVNSRHYEMAFAALADATTSLSSLKRDEFEETSKRAVPNSFFDYQNTFGRLGNVDFDRAMFLAQGIKWREFRLAAEIATCQSVLGKKG